MVDEHRLQILHDSPVQNGSYVLYWMQASQRTRWNHALQYAVEQANALRLPVVVVFGLMDDYPEANQRHYAFMLDGLADVKAQLAEIGIQFVVKHGNPPEAALALAADAALIVCDRGYLRLQRRWRDEVADGSHRRLVQVETDAVVPVEQASDKQEIGARTLRPRLHRLWDRYLVPFKHARPDISSINLKIPSDLDVSRPREVLAALKLDRSVSVSQRLKGGSSEGQRLLRRFMGKHLDGYQSRRNEPSAQATSFMAAYLHFGQISPADIAMRVRHATAPLEDREAYLEELIVRRELSLNFVLFNPDYDRYASIPAWAKKSLARHEGDARPIQYTRQQLEAAHTHDRYWNAAQQEMTRTGFMHNYMRMYWGKQILQWKADPGQAYDDMLYLNNKYFLCGRGPNAYANVGWIFGLADRPWGDRQISGNVRFMNAGGLERKFDMDRYVDWVSSLQPAPAT